MGWGQRRATANTPWIGSSFNDRASFLERHEN